MTDTLLIIIAVLLAVRIVLQLRQGKRAFEKMYQATSEVKNIIALIPNEKGDIMDAVRINNKAGYELVQVVPQVRANDELNTMLIFTRKKIKNFYED